ISLLRSRHNGHEGHKGLENKNIVSLVSFVVNNVVSRCASPFWQSREPRRLRDVEGVRDVVHQRHIRLAIAIGRLWAESNRKIAAGVLLDRNHIEMQLRRIRRRGLLGARRQAERRCKPIVAMATALGMSTLSRWKSKTAYAPVNRRTRTTTA